MVWRPGGFGIRIGVLFPFHNNPFQKGIVRNPNHRAPNHQLTTSWLKNPFEKYARQIGSFPQGLGWKYKNIWNHHLDLEGKNDSGLKYGGVQSKKLGL